tara:strand:+ start:695 stop:1198 length:504 start_codon:yes stop_codon:yes gene_type:complete
MKKGDILREELGRMRQLMGMNGSLYQKPIVGEDEQLGVRGHMATEPNARDYRGGESGEAYQAALATYQSQHRTPQPAPRPPASPPASPPPSPPPSPPSPKPKNLSKRSLPKTGTGSSSALDSGQYVLPAGSTPGAKGKIGRAKSKSISRKAGGKKTNTKKTKKKKDS